MFSNMKVSTRLALGFGVVIALLVILSVMSIQRMANMNELTRLIVDDRLPKMQMSSDQMVRTVDNGRKARAMLLATTSAEADQLKPRFWSTSSC